MKLILGHSKTGQSIARFLEKHNESFVIYDDKNPTEIPEYDTVIKSPGVPLTHPLCQGKKIMTELDFFKPKARVIAVTGTSGKTTLTTLIYEFLKHNKIETALGGNIGTPILNLPELSENGIYVLELSSFQLETAPTLPIDIAILLNLMPNHLDRHETMDAYLKAKAHIFDHAKIGIIGQDIELSTTTPLIKASQDPKDILEHIADIVGLSKEGIDTVLNQFKGIEHRLEIVAKTNNAIYVNDSKGTTFFAVGYAISKFQNQGDIHLIMGGGIKEYDASYLEGFLKNVSHLYIFGPNRHMISEMLSPYKKADLFETLDDVMHNLKLNPNHMNVVLLSPGGTSYDLYKIYSERGDHFKKLVHDLTV